MDFDKALKHEAPTWQQDALRKQMDAHASINSALGSKNLVKQSSLKDAAEHAHEHGIISDDQLQQATTVHEDARKAAEAWTGAPSDS